MASLINWLSLIGDNFIPLTRIRFKKKEKNPVKAERDNFVGVNLLRLPGRTTGEQEIIFRKILDLSSFLLKNHLEYFLIHRILYYHNFEISGYKKDRNQTGGKKSHLQNANHLV